MYVRGGSQIAATCGVERCEMSPFSCSSNGLDWLFKLLMKVHVAGVALTCYVSSVGVIRGCIYFEEFLGVFFAV